MNQISLDTNFKLSGEWWLPNNFNKRIHGNLTYSPPGISMLELNGSLFGESFNSFNTSNVAKFYGTTSLGEKCSLFDVFESFHQFGGTGKSVSKVIFNTLVKGNEFIDIKTDKFESASFQLFGFKAWYGDAPLRMQIYKNSPSKILSAHLLKPKVIKHRIKSINTTFEFIITPNNFTTADQMKMDYAINIIVRPSVKKHFTWYLTTIYPFRQLISLLIARPTQLTMMKISKKKKRIYGVSKKYNYSSNFLDVIYTQSDYVALKDSKINRHEIPYPLAAIKKDFATILNNWYKKSSYFGTIYDLHFSTYSKSSYPIDVNFLFLTQAIEGFHRKKGGGRGLRAYLTEHSYTHIKDALINAIPTTINKDHRAALKNKIKYGYEYSLRKRFTLLLKNVPHSIKALITKNDKNFVMKIINTRNYLTHRDKSLEKVALDMMGKYEACNSMHLMLTYLLLSECGIPSKLRNKIFTTHRKYNT